LLHPSSSASGALRRSQLTPSHAVVVLPLALPLLTVAFTVVQPYAVEWR
jgi:hypothetical protein